MICNLSSVKSFKVHYIRTIYYCASHTVTVSFQFFSL